MTTEEGYVPQIRMEEAEIGPPLPPPIGFELNDCEQDQLTDPPPSRARDALISELIKERQAILTDQDMSTKEKLRLLESNRKTIVVASGGTLRDTENVVYGILIFGGAILVVLALLTVFADLPAEITLTFVGTVLGGTIATIAQKVGRI